MADPDPRSNGRVRPSYSQLRRQHRLSVNHHHHHHCQLHIDDARRIFPRASGQFLQRRQQQQQQHQHQPQPNHVDLRQRRPGTHGSAGRSSLLQPSGSELASPAPPTPAEVRRPPNLHIPAQKSSERPQQQHACCSYKVALDGRRLHLTCRAIRAIVSGIFCDVVSS